MRNTIDFTAVAAFAMMVSAFMGGLSGGRRPRRHTLGAWRFGVAGLVRDRGCLGANGGQTADLGGKGDGHVAVRLPKVNSIRQRAGSVVQQLVKHEQQLFRGDTFVLAFRVGTQGKVEFTLAGDAPRVG